MDLILIIGFLIGIIGVTIYVKFEKLANATPVQLLWFYVCCFGFILFMYRLSKMKIFELSVLFFFLSVVIVAYLASLDVFYWLIRVRAKSFMTDSFFKKRVFLLCWILGESVYVGLLAIFMRVTITKHLMTKFFSLPFDAIVTPAATLIFFTIVFIVRLLLVDWVGLIGEFCKTFKRQKLK